MIRIEVDMRSRHFPWIAAVVFVIATILVVASFGEHSLYSSRQMIGADPGWSVFMSRGRMVASRHHPISNYISIPAEPTWRNGGGFSYERSTMSGQVMAEHLAIPTYPLVVVTGLVLAWRMRRLRRIPIAGCCANCGYDLRASPGRCPECGRSTATLPAGDEHVTDAAAP
jgi:hypothetical protein